MAAKCLIVFADFVESSVAEPPEIAIKGRFVVGADFLVSKEPAGSFWKAKQERQFSCIVRDLYSIINIDMMHNIFLLIRNFF